jgi:hypothetical protein
VKNHLKKLLSDDKDESPYRRPQQHLPLQRKRFYYHLMTILFANILAGIMLLFNMKPYRPVEVYAHSCVNAYGFPTEAVNVFFDLHLREDSVFRWNECCFQVADQYYLIKPKNMIINIFVGLITILMGCFACELYMRRKTRNFVIQQPGCGPSDRECRKQPEKGGN